MAPTARLRGINGVLCGFGWVDEPTPAALQRRKAARPAASELFAAEPVQEDYEEEAAAALGSGYAGRRPPRALCPLVRSTPPWRRRHVGARDGGGSSSASASRGEASPAGWA